MCLYVHPTPILPFLSFASPAAFNKPLVCSFFHLASFGFCLFCPVTLLICAGSVTFFRFPILFTTGCFMLRFKLHSVWVCRLTWTWLDPLIKAAVMILWRMLNLICNTGQTSFWMIVTNHYTARLWPFQFSGSKFLVGAMLLWKPSPIL